MLPKYKDLVERVQRDPALEAQENIMQLCEAAIDLQEENMALRRRVRELEGKLASRTDLQWDQPYYWLIEGAHRDGPYCQLCYDREQLLIRLHSDEGTWRCPACATSYDDGGRETLPLWGHGGDNY